MFRVVRMMILQQTLPSSSAAGAAVHHACQTSKVLKYNKRGDRLARKTPKNGRGGKHLGRHQTISTDHHRGSFERPEEHTSELQTLMRISYAFFFLDKTLY